MHILQGTDVVSFGDTATKFLGTKFLFIGETYKK
jgi:hypothetical protein